MPWVQTKKVLLSWKNELDFATTELLLSGQVQWPYRKAKCFISCNWNFFKYLLNIAFTKLAKFSLLIRTTTNVCSLSLLILNFNRLCWTHNFMNILSTKFFNLCCWLSHSSALVTLCPTLPKEPIHWRRICIKEIDIVAYFLIPLAMFGLCANLLSIIVIAKSKKLT